MTKFGKTSVCKTMLLVWGRIGAKRGEEQSVRAIYCDGVEERIVGLDLEGLCRRLTC